MQLYVLAISIVLIAAVAASFLIVVKTSSQTAGEAGAAADTEKIRSGLFWLLTALGIVVTFVSLRPWPHPAGALAGHTVLNVTGSMWSWDIDKKAVPAGTPIVFRVTSNDVNHGFGVANAQGTILFQTQGMPGYINQVEYTFSNPGTYQVLCLEYCGLAHHTMRDEIKVIER